MIVYATKFSYKLLLVPEIIGSELYCFNHRWQIIKSGLMGPLELGNRLAMTTSQVSEAFVEMGKAVRELD